MTTLPNWSRRVRGLASGSSLELIQWVRDAGAQLNSEQYISKFSGKSPNSLVTGAPGDLTVNVSLTSGTPGDLWTQQASTVSRSGWTRLVSSAAGGSGAPTNSAYVILGKDATLTSARSLAAGTNITLTDGGAASVLTISATASSATSTTITSRLSATVGSSNITLDLPGVGTAGSYAYVTTDAYGRVTAGSASLSTTSITGSFTTNQIVGSWTTNSIVGSWTTNAIVGSWTTNSIVGSWTTASIVGAWTSDVSSSNISVNDLNIADGTALAPSFDYKSEQSLGWYRSANSVMALSYGTLVIPGLSILSVGGFSWFGGQVYIGPDPGVLTRPPVNACFVNSNITNTTNSGISGAMFGYDVEPTFSSTATATSATFYLQTITAASGITFWDLAGLMVDSLHKGTGSSVSTYYGVFVKAQTGAATNYAIFTNSGRVWFGDNVWCTSGISVGSSGNTGTLIPAISSMSSKVAAFVVQGSSSSFRVFAWPAVGPGDQILTTIFPDTAVSSLSSGLIAHSHCTKAGQFEMRLSNVSTLVQNQSAKTWYFTRIDPF